MQNPIITEEMLKNGKDNDKISGSILVKDYQYKVSEKNQKKYIIGRVQSIGMMGYKIWSDSQAFEFFENNKITNQVCNITGKFSEFNGIVSLIIEEIELVPEAIPLDFIESKYDTEAFFNHLHDYCEKMISPKGMNILEEIFFNDEELMFRFKNEFAAKSHHDNCKSGLLAHTYKVMKLLGVVLSIYKNVSLDLETGITDKDKIDLMMIGALLHDIGKIEEMNYGVYIEGSFVTHRIIGLEYILKHKELFVNAYSEMWFKYLEAIIMQHHNMFGEHCKTVYSFLVHLVDDLDSKLTLLDQLIPDADPTPAGKTISVREMDTLNFM